MKTRNFDILDKFRRSGTGPVTVRVSIRKSSDFLVPAVEEPGQEVDNCLYFGSKLMV